MTGHPVYDELAVKYHYDTLTRWSFEDGPCGHQWTEDGELCDCPRPWSDAWEKLCWAMESQGADFMLILHSLRDS